MRQCIGENTNIHIVVPPWRSLVILALIVCGGIINFVMEEEKVRFEINEIAANQAKLQIRSQLLRLATRVIERKLSQEAKD